MQAIEKPHPRVGRPCSTCSHPERSEIENLLLSRDATISTLSSDFGISIASLRRHLRHHIALSADEIADAGLSGVEIITRLADAAERLQDAADAAEERGRTADMVRALDAQRRVLLSLFDLGVQHEDVPLLLERSRSLSFAVVRASKADPALGECIALELDAYGHTTDANALRNLLPNDRPLEAHHGTPNH